MDGRPDDSVFPIEPYRPAPIPADGGRRTPEKPTRLKRLDTFLAEYVPLEYALEPIVRTGSLYTLTARTGAGKTAWLISVALAVATGRRDILGFEVEQGRVAFLTFENPDDVRMRLQVSAWLLNVDIRQIADKLVVLDRREKPEQVAARLELESRDAPLRLVLVDTLAAFFDGTDINDNVQGGGFMRKLRPITHLPGSPAVLVAAHPVKNASADNLLPYGGGAILNEVDGNLTLWRRAEGGVVDLHWQGKLRGLEFAPQPFRFQGSTSPTVKDAKGREIELPTIVPATISDEDIEAKEKADVDVNRRLLEIVRDDAGGRQREWAKSVDRSLSVVSKKLGQLEREKLIEKLAGKYAITAKGLRALKAHGGSSGGDGDD